MVTYKAGTYEVVVIGAGHAGIESALAAAKLGAKTAIFTMNLDSVGNCPCNPSIGGTAKGHLVREVDALGGQIGKTADECCIQSRMLNKGKGPAVYSLRAQIDREKYKSVMKHTLELSPNLDLRQAEVVNLCQNDDKTWQVTTRTGAEYTAKTVVLATGTYLNGKIFVGETSFNGGPDGLFAATFLSGVLKKLGIKLKRFKTGTPARVLRSSINFEHMEEQFGDEPVVPFSYSTKGELKNKVTCHIGWTNETTKKIVLENLHRSPLYSGKIEGQGPRYCPSIEDKIVRFKDKDRHQIFVEPCGQNTEEMYLQGLSSSLPEDVQIDLYRSIKGLEKALIMRPAYAIEYDCIDSVQLDPSLEFIDFEGLFAAGQIVGSSGYEEAAAQGIIAGINAARKTKHREKFILGRDSSYIGTLIDDLTTKGASDPYRMMTSRSEYRLVLRQDNADERLMPLGYEIGLVDEEQWTDFKTRKQQKEEESSRVKNTVIPPSDELNDILVSRETSVVDSGVRLVDLLKRPQINYACLLGVDKNRPKIDEEIFEKVEIEIKYEGYIKKQKKQIEETRRLDLKKIPKDIDYAALRGLRLEAIEKLQKVKPDNVGAASRISGVSPADISVLLIWISKIKRAEGDNGSSI